MFLLLIVAAVIRADTLQSILSRGSIRIGTTGDYKPLTWYDDKTKQYAGTDIKLAKKIANVLNVKAVFVKTTWPKLASDLTNNKFDIAIGGISITPDRELHFIFSEPILIDHKVAVIRCVNKNRLKSLRDIDQQPIRVIENKGGTNEKFARSILNHASLIIDNSNLNIFDKIINNDADVMFTDGAEAKYQKELHSQLCIVQLDPMIAKPYAKAIMMHSDDKKLQQRINQALHFCAYN